MLATDLRWALRHLARRPGFVLLGVLGLGLGLAAAVMVFMAVNTLTLRPVAGIHTERTLVEIGRVEGDGGFDSFSFPDYRDLRENSTTLDKVFAYRIAPAYVRIDEAPTRALAFVVSGDYFEALGVGATHGRLIAPIDDATAGEGAVAVASHPAFQRLFAGDSAAIGRPVEINGTRYTLVGVAEPGFHGHMAALSPDFYVPLAMSQAMHLGGSADRESRSARSLLLGGRVTEGATIGQVNEELRVLASNLAGQYPDSNRHTGFAAAPLKPLPQGVQRLLGMLATALFVLCAAILALACTNLAGVLLAQGEARAGELAMRSALGASRGRVARQLFIEAALVAIVAGALALGLVAGGRGVLNLLPMPAPFPIDLSLQFDWRVVVFCFGATAVVAIGFGLLPALRISASAPGRDAALAGAGVKGSRQRLRHGLLAFQAMMTVAMLLTAALVLRALDAADGIDTGFRVEDVYTADVDLTPAGMETGPATAVLDRLVERLEAEPGVSHASYASVVPLTMSRLGFGLARLPGAGDGIPLDVNTVGEGFFDVFDLPVRGRPVGSRDLPSGERTAVINRSFARRLFGEDEPVGREFEVGYDTEWQRVRVVGVTSDGRYTSMSDEGSSFAFLAAAQWDRSEFTLMVHGDIGAEALRRAIEREMRVLLPAIPPPPVHHFASSAALSILPQVILGTAASGLGLLALVLSATGLYGMLAFQVERRVRELGVRKALGAPSRQVVRTLLQRTSAWLVAGAVLGLALGQVAAVALGELLFGIAGSDPVALSVVLAVFIAMAAAAAALPVRRTLRLHPMEALRHD